MRWLGVLVLLLAGAAQAQSVCKPARCDINGDGIAGDQSDYLAFFYSMGSGVGESKYNLRADFDGDGGVTAEDYGVLMSFCPIGRK